MPFEKLDTNHLVGQKVKNRYQIGKFMASGAFGSFHLGLDVERGDTPVAIKFEREDAPQAQLMLEYCFYIKLGSGRDAPKFIPYICHYCKHDGYSALVMELLGPSLLAMMRTCGGTFSIATTTQVTIQLLAIIEYVHERRLLYRDVKPENFLFGKPDTDKWCTVHLIDLGFAKSYIDQDPASETYRRHIPFVTEKPIAGTLRYMSANNHFGRELGRRDDLEAILYMAIYMFRQELPWETVACDEPLMTKIRMRGEMKRTIDPAVLCADMPPAYGQCLREIRSLDFEEMPPYRRLIGLLRSVLQTLGIIPEEQCYDWDRSHRPKPRSLRL